MKNIDLRPFLGKMKGLPPAQLYVALGVVVAILLALDIVLVFRGQINGIMAIDRKAAKIKADIATLATNKQRMTQFRTSLDLARKEMADFKAMVRMEDQIPVVLQRVSTLANECGVKIDQLIPQKSDGNVLVKNEDGKYTSLSILVRAKAGYHQLGRLLSRLEQEKVFWYLENVEIVADATDPARHLVKMYMKILILGK